MKSMTTPLSSMKTFNKIKWGATRSHKNEYMTKHDIFWGVKFAQEYKTKAKP